jgi:gamma-glutamyltranspeptidase
MVESTMGDAVLDEVERRGLGLMRVSPWEPEMGSCHSVRIADDGELSGAADPRRLGRVAADLGEQCRQLALAEDEEA